MVPVPKKPAQVQLARLINSLAIQFVFLDIRVQQEDVVSIR